MCTSYMFQKKFYDTGALTLNILVVKRSGYCPSSMCFLVINIPTLQCHMYTHAHTPSHTQNQTKQVKPSINTHMHNYCHSNKYTHTQTHTHIFTYSYTNKHTEIWKMAHVLVYTHQTHTHKQTYETVQNSHMIVIKHQNWYLPLRAYKLQKASTSIFPSFSHFFFPRHTYQLAGLGNQKHGRLSPL